jgi:thiaminase
LGVLECDAANQIHRDESGVSGMNAKELLTTIRGTLRGIEQEIRDHPYLAALEEKAVELDHLKAFPGHQYHIVSSDLRSVALMVHRFDDPSAQDFFNGVLQGEVAAMEGIVALAGALQMTEDDLRRFPVTADGFAYTTYMAWQSLYGSAAEVACGFLVNFEAWGSNCGRMSAALREHYEFSKRATGFLDAFAEMPSFEEAELRLIQAGLDDGVEPALIERAAWLFQSYEKKFWDAMAEAAGIRAA